jgi:hypothetical protein
MAVDAGRDASLHDAGDAQAVSDAGQFDASLHDAGVSEGATDAGVTDSGASSCEGLANLQQYEPGLVASGTGAWVVNLLESEPAAPSVGINQWLLEVTNADGEALQDAAVRVVPYMPEHHHGSPLSPAVLELGEGQYQVENIYLTMPGYWRFTVHVAVAELEEQLLFELCIE